MKVKSPHLDSDHGDELLLQVVCIHLALVVFLLVIPDEIRLLIDFLLAQINRPEQSNNLGQAHDPQLQREVSAWLVAPC